MPIVESRVPRVIQDGIENCHSPCRGDVILNSTPKLRRLHFLGTAMINLPRFQNMTRRERITISTLPRGEFRACPVLALLP